MDDSDFEDDVVEVKKRPAGSNAVSTKKLTPEQLANEAIQDAIDFAETKMTLGEMVYYVDTEIHRIEGEQRARLLAGFITKPTEEQIERIARWNAVLRWLSDCHYKPREAASQLNDIARRREVKRADD